MQKQTIVYGLLVVVTLTIVSLVIGTIDMYIAVSCALVADIYVILLSRKKRFAKTTGSRIAPLMLVAVVPAVICGVLYFWGFFGSSFQAVFRITLTVGFSIAFFITSYPIIPAAKFKGMEEQVAETNSTPLVSILVPAYNEQEVISRTLDSLVNLKYENKEIIVIDDGSTDLTKYVAQEYEKQGVRVLTKPNGGKASALNYGLLFAKGEIVVTIDSDSMVTRDAVNMIVKAMASDPNNVAVAGNIKVLNSKSVLTKIQELDYIMAINTIRRAFALFGAVMVIPGAFGAFKKERVSEVGGYDTDTLTEDFDITIKLLKTRGAVSSSSEAHAYTEVPSTWKALYRQRLRWGTGTFQTLLKHKDIFGNPRYGALHSFVFPIMLFSLFNPLASFVALTSGMVLALTGGAILFARMLVMFLLIQLFVALLALSLDNEGNELAVYSPFFVFIYKQFIDIVTLVSIVKALSKKEKKWQKLQRSGGLEAIKVRSG
ncbi:MAG: glycosyltransferase [Candidatus Bathyarchaeota archaeon]|nr:glycosyltransferase [Candidatus Bathyarchaeota archaeon]